MYFLNSGLLPKCYVVFGLSQILDPHYRCEVFSPFGLISRKCFDVCTVSEAGGEDFVIVLEFLLLA